MRNKSIIFTAIGSKHSLKFFIQEGFPNFKVWDKDFDMSITKSTILGSWRDIFDGLFDLPYVCLWKLRIYSKLLKQGKFEINQILY